MAKLPVNKKSRKIGGHVSTASQSRTTKTRPKKYFKKEVKSGPLGTKSQPKKNLKKDVKKSGPLGTKTRPKKNFRKNVAKKSDSSGTPTKPTTKTTAFKVYNSQMAKKINRRGFNATGTKARKNMRDRHGRRATPDIDKKIIAWMKSRQIEMNEDEKLMKKFSKVKETPVVQDEKIEIDPTHLISLEMLQAAVSGLRKLPSAGKSEKKSLHDITDEDERFIYLQVTLCKLRRVNEDLHLAGPTTVNVYLPHSLVKDNTDVILITKDLQKGYKRDHQKSLDHFKELLHNHGAASLVNEVIPLHQLKFEYQEFEAKRLLANRTDVLLCDDTVMRFIPKFLTKHFYAKKKLPVQVNLKARDLLKELQRALSVSRLFFSMKGNSSIMKIGCLSQTDDEIQENVLEAVRKLASYAPGKWANIQGLSLKLERTPSIPLYVKMDSLNSVKPLPFKRILPGEPVSGTLTTQPWQCITVFPDGSVTSTNLRKNYKRIAKEKKATAREEAAKKEKLERASKASKKGKRAKRKSPLLENDLEGIPETMEREPSSTKEKAKKNSIKRKAMEEKSSKVKKQKTAHDSDSDSGEEDLEEQEMMYLSQLNQRDDDPAGNQEEAEDSDDVWADSESDVEDID